MGNKQEIVETPKDVTEETKDDTIEKPEEIKRTLSDIPTMIQTFNPHPYSLSVHTQSMQHYVDDLHKWLDRYKQNEASIYEKEKEHQQNVRKQKKRQAEYNALLQKKQDRQNEKFKQQFFKQLEIQKTTPPSKPIVKQKKKEAITTPKIVKAVTPKPTPKP